MSDPASGPLHRERSGPHPADVGRAARDRRALPRGPLGPAADAAPRAVGRGPGDARGHRGLRRDPRHLRRRGQRRRDLLHDVQAQARRRLPRRRLHQHAVRGHGWRPDLRAAQGAPRRRQRRDHRRRQDHPRARRVQRGLRLRPGDDGQLGVHGQPDARVGRPGSSTTCAPARRSTPPGVRACAPGARPSGCSPASPTTSPTRARPPVPPRWSGLGIARERGWTAPGGDAGGRTADEPAAAATGADGSHEADRQESEARGPALRRPTLKHEDDAQGTEEAK